jgi:hypothetical protein
LESTLDNDYDDDRRHPYYRRHHPYYRRHHPYYRRHHHY